MEKFYETYAKDFDFYAPRTGGNWLNADGQWEMDKPNKALSDCGLSNYSISMGMTCISKMRPSNFTFKGMQDLGKSLKRLARNLWDKQMRNLGLFARRDMGLDPAHRARVLEDLGGWKAMRSWRERYDKSFDYSPPKAASPCAAAKPTGERGGVKNGVKTDRDGLFRLPVIKTQFERALGYSQSGASRASAYVPALAVFKPIEVHPDDLDYTPDVKALRKGLRTAEAPMALADWRDAIIAEYVFWITEIDALILSRLSELLDFEGGHDLARLDAPP